MKFKIAFMIFDLKNPACYLSLEVTFQNMLSKILIFSEIGYLISKENELSDLEEIKKLNGHSQADSIYTYYSISKFS